MPAPPTDCLVCGGSVNERARKRVLLACRSSGVRHILVVGGSPRTREQLCGDYLERRSDGTQRPLGIAWRLVDGTARATERSARADLAWADIVVIWATTILDHKVSTLYVNGQHPRTITCAQRGVAGLCDGIVRSLSGDRRPSSCADGSG